MVIFPWNEENFYRILHSVTISSYIFCILLATTEGAIFRTIKFKSKSCLQNLIANFHLVHIWCNNNRIRGNLIISASVFGLFANQSVFVTMMKSSNIKALYGGAIMMKISHRQIHTMFVTCLN